MGVSVRQKKKGKGEPWWVFISHNGKRTSRKVGAKKVANEVAHKVREKLYTMGTVYKRGNIFWLKYFRDGKPYYESSKSKDADDAKNLLKIREGQIAEDKLLRKIEQNGVHLVTVKSPNAPDPCVYFIQKGERGAVKIGFSTNIDSRMKTLQTANSKKLRLVGVFYGDTNLEGEIQARFGEDRLLGEWFRPTFRMERFLSANLVVDHGTVNRAFRISKRGRRTKRA